MQITSPLTLEEFLKLPETKPASEYIDGVVFQKPMPQGKHSTLQIELASAINNQGGKAQKIAYAFTELRCTFANRSIVPDIAVFEWQRIPLDEQGQVVDRFEIPPDWIIEILSPEQSTNKVIGKIVFCLKQGTKLGYLIDTDDQSITVFQPNQLPDVKEKQDVLPVLEALQHWQITVKDIFNYLSFISR